MTVTDAEVKEMRDKIDLLYYLVDNQVHIIPLAPGSKHPKIKDWLNYWVDDWKIPYYVANGYGFGIIPDETWLYIDIDCDHTSGSDGLSNAKEIIKDEEFNTLTAKKHGSRNLHLFYRNTNQFDVFRYTGNKAVRDGVEVSSKRSQVRIFPDYKFTNLDMTKPFMDQLLPRPVALEPTPEKVHKVVNHNIGSKRMSIKALKSYLSKVEEFEPGTRSDSYRTLMYTLVIKNNCNPITAKKYVDEWDESHGNFKKDDEASYEHATRNPLAD